MTAGTKDRTLNESPIEKEQDWHIDRKTEQRGYWILKKHRNRSKRNGKRRRENKKKKPRRLMSENDIAYDQYTPCEQRGTDMGAEKDVEPSLHPGIVSHRTKVA
jgi:hypothetical protein